MVSRPCSFASRAIVILALLVASSTCWAIGVEEGGGKKPPLPETVTFQPAVWEPYIPELYVKPMPGAEANEKAARLNMEKPEGELPGLRPAWKSLKQRFGFDNLGARNEATGEIVSGWTRSETGFLVHATSQITPSGEAKIVEQLIAEAPSLLYAAVGIDFGTKSVKADKEAYLLGKYFKAIVLKITAHEIESRGTEYNLEDIRGTSNSEPLLTLSNFDVEFNRPWSEIAGHLTSTGEYDKQLSPWRTNKFVEMRVELEVEGRLSDTEEAVRKKTIGAIRFIVLRPKSIQIDKLSGESERK